MAETKVDRKPGGVPWEEKRKELGEIVTNEEPVKKVWQESKR